MFSSCFKHIKVKLCSVLFWLFCTLLASGAHAQINLNFGVYTTDKPTTMVRAFRPILSAIEEQLSLKLEENVTIKLQVASSYQKGIDALVTGEVDFGMLGPASYIEAQKLQSEFKILALDSFDGAKIRFGIVCVREDSDINSVAELKGKRFAFGNEGSTIGRYLSQAMLTRNGVLAHDLESFDYLGRHDRVAHAVAQGTHDAGALKEGTYIKLKKKGLKLRTLTRIPLINRPWLARAKLDPEIFAALQESMLNLDAPEAFKAMGRRQFVAGSDSDFADIRTAIDNNSAFFASSVQKHANAED